MSTWTITSVQTCTNIQTRAYALIPTLLLFPKLIFNNNKIRVLTFLFLPEQLKTAIESELRAHSLQVNNNAVTKVIQLYETKTSRHAVMIVGPTQAAKTVTWRVLQASMTRLNRDGDINYQAVKVRSYGCGI